MVVLQFHLEGTDGIDAAWWVDSPDLPSLFVTASRLAACQRLALDHLDDMDIDSTQVSCVLAGAGRVGPPARRNQQLGVSEEAHEPGPRRGPRYRPCPRLVKK